MISIIAAYARERVIGVNGRIPWRIKGEQLRFRELTMGNVVVMGRRTFEEIGRPLPGRTTAVVSRTWYERAIRVTDCERISPEESSHAEPLPYLKPGLYAAGSLSQALLAFSGRDIIIAGGEKLYEEALPIADRMYLTEIDAEISPELFPKAGQGTCFARFPRLKDPAGWKVEAGEWISAEMEYPGSTRKEPVRYRYLIYERKAYKKDDI